MDSIETVDVLNTPFLGPVWTFYTKRGGGGNAAGKRQVALRSERSVSGSDHLRGIRNETPRAVAGGPLIKDRLSIISALQYTLDKVPSRTLPLPFNVSKQERVNSFTPGFEPDFP